MAKIISVEPIVLEAPIGEPVLRARQTVPITARRAMLVKITTDNGLYGVGEGLSPVAPRVAATIVRDVFTPFLLGQNPLNTETIWEKLYGTMSSRGYSRGFQMVAISAVDIALWDLKGKILNQPIYRLLGGACSNPIPVYTTGLMLREKDELAALAKKYLADGFRAMKLKIGESVKKDIENIATLREVLGDSVKLMVDANGGYDPSTAIQLGQMMSPYQITWFEEPVRPENIRGSAEVARILDIPIAAGECEYTKYGFREIFLQHAVDIIQPDVARAGGITECKKIAALAQAFNIPYAPHAWGGAVCIAATLHLAASLPNFLICEFDRVPNPLRDELLVEPLRYRDSYLFLPEKPGLGIELNKDALEKYRMQEK